MFIKVSATNRSLSRRSLVFGVGINDADYITKHNGVRCPIYQKWKGMLQRCYDPLTLNINPCYRGCTVCDDWLTFSVFAEWMESKDWEGLELDKDILFPGNRVYSPDKCVFIPRDLNSLLNSSASAGSPFPVGVSYNERDHAFISKCRYKGRRIHLGSFSCPKEAGLAYINFKTGVIMEYANKHKGDDVRIYKGLEGYCKAMIESGEEYAY